MDWNLFTLSSLISFPLLTSELFVSFTYVHKWQTWFSTFTRLSAEREFQCHCSMNEEGSEILYQMTLNNIDKPKNIRSWKAKKMIESAWKLKTQLRDIIDFTHSISFHIIINSIRFSFFSSFEIYLNKFLYNREVTKWERVFLESSQRTFPLFFYSLSSCWTCWYHSSSLLLLLLIIIIASGGRRVESRIQQCIYSWIDRGWYRCCYVERERLWR